MRIIFCAIFFAGVSGALPATAEVPSDTAKSLVDGCKALSAIEDGTASKKYPQDEVWAVAMRAGYCSGYITGFVGGYSKGTYKSPGKEICIPEGASTSQIGRVLAQKLDEKPQFEHIPQLPFVIAALWATWPCPGRALPST